MKTLRLPIFIASFFLVMNGVILLVLSNRGDWEDRFYGKVIHEATSDYSQIRIRERDGLRNMLFVDKNGEEQRQSAMLMERPHELQLRYSRSIFASLFFQYPQERVLIVGLGGGGMVRFLNHVLPQTQVEAVEIDPVVVELAETYFGVVNEPPTTIFTEDAFVFLAEPHGPYDVIYMDAFLKPPADSGLEEKTLRLKTVEFLQQIQTQLKPEGILAFNLIESDASTESDLLAIRDAFPQNYLFSVAGTGNLIVIASMDAERLSQDELKTRAETLDAELELGFSLSDVVDGLRGS